MKVNQKTCPCCGHEIEQTEWLFKEQHESEWKRQMKANKFYAENCNFGKDFGVDTDCVDCTIREHRYPKPAPLIGWELSNPQPKMNMVEFVVQLHNRITALEAALAEKGGNV